MKLIVFRLILLCLILGITLTWKRGTINTEVQNEATTEVYTVNKMAVF